MNDLRKLIDKIQEISECNCQTHIQPVSSISMHISFSTTDGTTVSKSFDNQEEFLQATEEIRKQPNITYYSFSTTETKSNENF